MNGVVIGGPGSGNAGGTTLSEQHKNAKKLLFKVKDSLERLERLESSTSTGAASSPELAFQINNDISHLHFLCIDMDRLWRSVAVKSQRDHWKRQVEQIAEDAESLKESLEKYFARNQRRAQEINERAELFGRVSGESSHVVRIFDDETQALQSARNSSRMLEDAYSSGVSILSKFSQQRESMKSAHRKLLDVLNTVGLSNSVLRLIERRNRVDTWIKYAGMILTFIVLIVMWRFLQNNYLSEEIPNELGNITGLQYLDISRNSFRGSIPPSLGQLNKLIALNMSYNFLVGAIPSNGVLGSFSQDSFAGNNDLCGKQINVVCKNANRGSSTNSTNSSSGSKKYPGQLFISASATVGALLLVALMCFWGCFLYKKLGKNDTKSLAMDVSGGASIVMFHGDLPYSSKDIIKKMEKLNDEHIIGSGGFGTVYKLAMDDGNVFALKRIVKVNDGFDRFFERELEILGSVKHRYLVNLRGYCNSPSSKLLIYDYLPGGSLDEALHERSDHLDWDARLNIIAGAAKGLAYLHHDCSPRIIHRDIKSSNILLDGNLDARVSDFGLAKLLEDEESHKTTIVAGTFGYLAPEYMQSGRATEKTDVYSFGVLVLELLSGKRPTDASFIEKGLNIVGWLNFLVTENRQRDIVDQHCEGVQQESLDALLSVAMQCVSSAPEDRLTMHRVVQILESEVMTPCPSEFYDSNSD